jgi:hypothetical protein
MPVVHGFSGHLRPSVHNFSPWGMAMPAGRREGGGQADHVHGLPELNDDVAFLTINNNHSRRFPRSILHIHGKH